MQQPVMAVVAVVAASYQHITSLCHGFGKERTRDRWCFYFPFHLQQTSFEERLPSCTNEHFDWKRGASHVQENTFFPTFLFHVKGFANHVVSLFLLAVSVWLGLEALKCPISVERWILSAGRSTGGCDWKELIGQHHCSGDLEPRLSPRETRKERIIMDCAKTRMWTLCLSLLICFPKVCYALSQMKKHTVVERMLDEGYETKISHAPSTLPVQSKHIDLATSDRVQALPQSVTVWLASRSFSDSLC